MDINKENILENYISRAKDSSSVFGEQDRVEAIQLINEKIKEIEIERGKASELLIKKEEEIKIIESSIDSLDDEKAVCDRKIKEITKEITDNGIDINDKENLLVKRLRSVEEERNVIEELSEKKLEQVSKINIEKDDIGFNDNELAKKIEIYKESKELINDSILQAKEDATSKRVKEKAEGKKITEHNPFLILLDSLIKRRSNVKMGKEMMDDAIKEELDKQKMIDARYCINVREEGEKGRNVEVENASDETKKCYGLIINNNNKIEIKILSESEYLDYQNSDEAKTIKDKINEETSLSEEGRSISVVLTEHDDRDILLDKLRHIVKEGVHNPHKIGSYANSQARKEKLMQEISSDAKVKSKIGGEKLNQVFGLNESIVTDLSIAKKLQPDLSINDTIEKRSKISEEDIPWNQLKKYNLSKKILSKENIDSLLKGGISNLITINGKNNKGENVRRSFKIILTNSTEGVCFKKLPVLPISNIDNRKVIGDIEFTQQDKDLLKKFGQLNHLVPFTGEDGKTKMMLVGLDKDTNQLFISDPNQIKVPQFIKEQCTKDELKRLYSGNAVHVENLKDNVGQKFNGWVVLSPHKNGQVLHLKHVDNEFKNQVRNNNYGERTEELKEDKDAKVKSKQNRSDDGVTSERKAYDFSTDSNGTTQRERTYKTTKSI